MFCYWMVQCTLNDLLKWHLISYYDYQIMKIFYDKILFKFIMFIQFYISSFNFLYLKHFMVKKLKSFYNSQHKHGLRRIQYNLMWIVIYLKLFKKFFYK